MKIKSLLFLEKRHLFFLFLFFLVSTVQAQSYCNYASQVTYDFGLTTQASDEPYGVIEQPDGKLVVYGTSYFSSAISYRVSVMRLNADLTLDTTGFGTGGKVVKTWDQQNTGVVGELQSDGKILVGGYQAPGNGFSTLRPYIGRFNSDGSIDTFFGTLGSTLINTYGVGSVIGLKELPNGKIRVVMSRYSPAGFVIMQLNPNGTIDNSFANLGSVFHPFPTAVLQMNVSGVLFTADTSAVVVCTSYSSGVKNPMVIKFLSDGDVDSTFAQNGVLDISQPISTPSSGDIVKGILTSGEDIIISATTGVNASRKMFMYKINGQTGAIDSTGFGTNGRVLSAQSSTYNDVKNLEIDPSNGDIYAVGSSSSSQKAATWRVSSSGVEINQCSSTPIKLFPLGYQYYSTFTVAKFVCNGKLRLLGFSGAVDTLSSYYSQSANYMIPYDTMPNPITYVSDTACDSYTSPSGNFVWDSTGTYMDTLTNVLGCDSLLSIDLVIKNSTAASISPIVCDVYISPSGLNSWTTSGTYMDTIPNAVGCDSVITVNLTVNYSTSSSISVTQCDSYISPSGNYTWVASGTYMDTIPNAAGCDSVITIMLTVNYSSASTISTSVCNSYVSPSGLVWTTSGTYMDTIPNAVGCDSVITVNLTVNMPTTATINVTACDHYESPNGVDIWLTSGTYSATIPNAAGCDSVITVNLTINSVDTGVVVNGFILAANVTGAQYQWLDCSKNYAKIDGATKQTFVPTANGNYAVEITENSCTDTSACFNVVGVGIDEQSLFTGVSFYPNPTNGELYLELGDLQQVAIRVYDLNGRMMYEENGVTASLHKINFNAAAGMYILELSSEGISKTYKLMVK